MGFVCACAGPAGEGLGEVCLRGARAWYVRVRAVAGLTGRAERRRSWVLYCLCSAVGRWPWRERGARQNLRLLWRAQAPRDASLSAPFGPRMAAAMAPALPEPPSEVPPEKEAAVRGRQAALWGRARSLCRRLRALQAQQVERHVRQQLAGLVRYMGRAAPAGLPRVLGPDLRQLAASATAKLRAAQEACDSDATDSSSGGGGGSSCGSEGETDSESPEEERPVPTPVANSKRHIPDF
nr:uncharacterized protein LOC116828392 [Chelonoidis abingdonii]